MHAFFLSLLCKNICKNNTLQFTITASFCLSNTLASDPKQFDESFCEIPNVKARLAVRVVRIVLFSLTCCLWCCILPLLLHTAETSKHRAARRFVHYAVKWIILCEFRSSATYSLVVLPFTAHSSLGCDTSYICPYNFLVCFSSYYLKVDKSVSLHTKPIWSVQNNLYYSNSVCNIFFYQYKV